MKQMKPTLLAQTNKRTVRNALLTQKQCKSLTRQFKNPTKYKMNRCSTNIIATVVILATLPYISTLNLPSGDPAPGRSPGPPINTYNLGVNSDKLDTNIEVSSDETIYDEATTNGEVPTTVSEPSVSDKTVDACAFARISSDSEEIVTLSERNSDVNVTFSHSVFQTEELVKGVIYDVHLQFEGQSLRDYVLYSIVGNFIRGNFTPTSFLERPCRDEEPLPYFIPKHTRNVRSKYRTRWQEQSEDYSFRTNSDGYYFRPKFSGLRVERSVYKFPKGLRYRYVPARIVRGPLGGRNEVLLHWSLTDTSHLASDETSVVFRLRYRKTTSATIFQVFYTKTLRLDCEIHVKASRSGRVHSGHLPRTRSCQLLFHSPAQQNALLIDLHKINVPCSSGSLRFSPNTPPLCGKLEQIPPPNRRYLYQSSEKAEISIHGRPTFAATYRLVDHCHDVLLMGRNGSFEVGPTTKLYCSYKIHLPYGNRVALRLQMGTGPIKKDADLSNIIHEDSHTFCKGMELNLVDGDSRWKHCSQPGDPLRSVQIISERNSVRLNISILAKKNSSAMWLKVWWMEKPIEDIIGLCDYGWVVSGDFCVTVVRESKKAWRQAEFDCERLGGHLASVLTERQQQIMDQLLINAPGGGIEDVYWIGATDAVHEGEFRWSDGLPFSYAHWFPGWRKHASQPNDDGTSGQDCVEARRELPPRPAHSTFMWNDRSCHEHNFYVCERPGVEDPYKASKVQCNESIVLSHAHPHATISSPGFPRPYPDDVSCVTEVRAPPAHTIRLHFEELLTEHEPHCSYDFLELIETGLDNITDHGTEEWISHDHHYALDNEVWEELETLLPESDTISAGWSRDTHSARVRRLCGDWSGKLKLLRYQSRGNAMRLRFRADHSLHFAGYRAKLTLTDTQSCMDVKQVLFNGYCYLFSGYPQASWTTAKQVCEGLNMHLSSVHTPEEERFIVTGVRQSSDYSAGSVYWLGSRVDVNAELSWIDGTTMDYQAWPPYNETEEIEDACLGVQWKTSPVPSQPSGLYWTLHKCTATGGYVCKRRLSSEHVLRNTTVEGTSGVLLSPNHPGIYDTDLDYWVHVKGPPDTRLVFVFSVIDLEYQIDCLYDFVELRDRKFNTKSSRYCGSLAETRWVATSNEAILHFHSDYNNQGSGFSVNWRAVELVGCPSQTFTSKEGILLSPNYPQFLLPELDCTIDIFAPAGKRVFLNISFFNFGYGTFENGVPINVTETRPEDNYIEVQVDPQSPPIRPFLNARVLTNGLFVSQSEILRLRLKTGENVTGVGFLAHFKTVWYVNASQIIQLGESTRGRLAAVNWPGSPPSHTVLRTKLFAPHGHTLSAAFARTTLVPTQSLWPCGQGKGWIEVKDSYTDNNGTQWTLCEVEKSKKKLEPNTPLIINSYLHSLIVTHHTGDHGMNMEVSLMVNIDPDYHNKILLLADETNLESCYPNPCLHGGRCAVDDSRNFCQCAGYYTGVFCLLTACERSPCVFGNCSLVVGGGEEDAFSCTCARGWRGKRCADRIRPCASRPCNNRGACVERDGTFLCQCNPSWKGKRCEIPNPTPNIVGLGTKMIQEPFWLGLFAVFSVLGVIGLIWCAKRHFPEKIEKLLAEEADRCARPRAEAPHRTLLTRLGIRKPSVSGLARPRAARTFSLDDLLKPPPGRKEWSALLPVHSATHPHCVGCYNEIASLRLPNLPFTSSPSPRKKRNNSTPTKKNAAEKKQILQQLISPAPANDHSKKITMGELIQMSERRTLSTVESAPAFVEYGVDNKDTSFASEASSPSTSPSMRQISDPKLEKKVTFARLLNKVSAEMSSSSDVDMVNTIAIPMAVIADRTIKAKASSTPPSPGTEVRSPHSTSSNQGSDSMSSLDLTLAHAALKKYSRTPKISSADSILAMFRNFSSSSAALASRASSGGISASSTPTASSPQDDTIDADDISIASSHIPSLAPDSPISRPHNTIEVQVVDPLSSHKCSASGNLLHPPSILLEVPSSVNKCLSPIRELPTPLPSPLPTPLPTPLPSPRMPRAKMESDNKSDSTITCLSPSEDELDDIKPDKMDRPTSGLRLKLKQAVVYADTPTPSTHVTDSPSPSFTHSQDSERELSSPSPAPPSLRVPVLTVERPSPGSPPPRRTPPLLDFQPPPLITVTCNASEESDEPLSPRPPPPTANMCYLSPFSMSARGERAPSESNLSSSGYSSMASPGPSRCGSSNPLCPSEMEDPGSGGGPSCFQNRRRPLMKTNSSPATSNDGGNERRRGRSDSETLSDDPLLESNDEGIGTDERVDDVPSSAKEMEHLAALKETLEIPQTSLCPPIGVTKCTIVKCVSVERGLDEKASLKPPVLFSDCSRPLSPVSSRSESPLSDKTGLGRFSPQFYGRQLPFTDSDGLYDFPSSECVKGSNCKSSSTAHRKAGRRRDRKTPRMTSHEVSGPPKSSLPHMPHSMHNLLEVPCCNQNRGRKGGRRRSRSQAPALATSSSSEESVSNASVASIASARELRLPDLEMQPEPTRLKKPLRRQKCRSSEDTSSKISSSLDLTEDSRKPVKVNKLRTIGNQIRFLRRLERSLKMKENYPAISDDEGDESSSVTSPLLQGRKDFNHMAGHAISAPLLGAARPKITRQRRYDKSLLNEDTRTFCAAPGHDNSD